MLKKYFSIYWVLFVLFSSLAYAAVDERPLDFFTNHNILHLVGWALIPRIMFIFVSAISGGILFWVGVILFPRLMVAYWATVYYWDTNLFLCIFAWVLAISGEFGEKIGVKKKLRR